MDVQGRRPPTSHDCLHVCLLTVDTGNSRELNCRYTRALTQDPLTPTQTFMCCADATFLCRDA